MASDKHMEPSPMTNIVTLALEETIHKYDHAVKQGFTLSAKVQDKVREMRELLTKIQTNSLDVFLNPRDY